MLPEFKVKNKEKECVTRNGVAFTCHSARGKQVRDYGPGTEMNACYSLLGQFSLKWWL
jgi:hypothetical protein